MHVVLMGLRASGKTTLARVLGRRLGRETVDLDERTSARLGSVHAGDALRRHGESHFRLAESEVLRDTLASPTPLVISLGGGTPTAPGARTMLLDARSAGKVWIAYLRASPSALQRRMQSAGERERPSLSGAGALEEVPAIHARRDPLYMTLASVIIDAEASTVEAMADEIIERLG